MTIKSEQRNDHYNKIPFFSPRFESAVRHSHFSGRAEKRVFCCAMKDPFEVSDPLGRQKGAQCLSGSMDEVTCCVCQASNTGRVSWPHLGFTMVLAVCTQCHDNGDLRAWFLEWFPTQLEKAMEGQ